MSIVENLHKLHQEIVRAAKKAKRQPEDILLLIVSKGRSLEEIKEAYQAGCRHFGENRVKEALQKMDQLPKDIHWHFIGKVQKNKVNKIVGRFTLIHSIDSFELAEKLSVASEKMGIKTQVLLEANTSGEESKSGLSSNQWEEMFPRVISLKGIYVKGVMTMAPYTENEDLIRSCFSKLVFLRERLKKIAGGSADLSILSMGMSHDFEIGIEEGATIIRIGTAVFHGTC